MDDTSRRMTPNEDAAARGEQISGRGHDEVRNYAAATPPDAELDQDARRRTQEIRHDIERTREDMSETIDAIQEKLRPGNIVAGATERVKQATTERLKGMAHSAGETAEGYMSHTRNGILETARQNPIPAALIGFGVAASGMCPSPARRPDVGSRPIQPAPGI